MAAVQPNKDKVCPVLDYRELNQHIDAFTADADIYATKLWEWFQQGVNVALLALQSPYLQIHIHESLWLFQTLIIKGKRYCLTHVRFNLNVAPLIMKAIFKTVLTQEEVPMRATSSYIDNIYICK